MRKKFTLVGMAMGTVLLVVALFVFHSCSGNSSNGGASSGTVALYATDDISAYKQVIATINKVQVRHTGSGAVCDVLTTPTTMDITNLANTLQLLNVTQCSAVPYNRLHIEFNKSVELMDALDTRSTCSFASYKDSSNHPNVLQCDATVCSVDVNGAVNVLVNRNNTVALDFDLKHFDVAHFGTPSCSVTMKVSPLHGPEIEQLHYAEGVTGLVSGLTVSTQTFTLAKHHSSFNVLYSGVTSTAQPGLDDLLLRAQEDGLRTRVTATTIDFSNSTIIASAITVKAEGKVSGLDTVNKTFTLTYKMGKTMKVDFSNAVTEGALADDAWVQVKLYGYDSVRESFLAGKVEIEFESTEPEDNMHELNTED
jgi:hypothetical protein